MDRNETRAAKARVCSICGGVDARASSRLARTIRAERAVAIAERRQPNETVHERAHRAVLLDSLSRRMYASGRDEAGLNAAEAAARLLILSWRERPDAYVRWLERMLGRLEMLCEEAADPDRFGRLIQAGLRDLEG